MKKPTREQLSTGLISERIIRIEKRLDVIEKALKVIASAAIKAHEKVKLSKWDD